MKVFESENEIRQITSLIGKPIKKGVVGSTTYYLKHIQDRSHSGKLLEDSKGIFELYSDGLLLRTFKSDKRKLIALPYSVITGIRLTKGREDVSPLLFSPFWVLLKLGVKVEIARYFKVTISEYRIEETALEITTNTGSIGLVTNGYTFPSQAKFFKMIKVLDKLQVFSKI